MDRTESNSVGVAPRSGVSVLPSFAGQKDRFLTKTKEENAMMNSFDEMFDFNHDGKLDWLERASQMSFLDMAMGHDDTGLEDDDFDLDDDNYDEW